MPFIRRSSFFACLALALPVLAHAWPGAIQMGTPIRVQSPTLGDSVVNGRFVRHDDSTLTFNPERGRHGSRIRFADIARLEADTNPTREVRHHGLLLAVMGGAAGFGVGYAVGAGPNMFPIGNEPALGVLMGAVCALPGAMFGAIVNDISNAGAPPAAPDHTWLVLPRDDWANGFALQAPAASDSTR